MRALILVDIQNDFLPGGALAVRDGDAVTPVANALMPHFDVVAATQDWHPPQHGSFAATHEGRRVGDRIDLNGLPQMLWPVHCVRNTPGAALATGLNAWRIARIFQKGADPRIDSYSGFFDNGRRHATGLGGYLTALEVREVCVMGLATDYCVKHTALDAVSLGFQTSVVEDGCRGVDLTPGDVVLAIEAMKSAGIGFVKSTDLMRAPVATR